MIQKFRRLALCLALAGIAVVPLDSVSPSLSHSLVPARVRQTHINDSYGRLPLSFEKNRGQVDGRVKFLSRGSGCTLFLTPTEAVLALNARTESTVLRMKLVGANPSPKVSGLEELSGKSNYFIGSDPAKWRTNVATFAKVKYRDVYPGIDLVYYGNQRQLEYDWIVSPGVDPGPSGLPLKAPGESRSTRTVTWSSRLQVAKCVCTSR